MAAVVALLFAVLAGAGASTTTGSHDGQPTITKAPFGSVGSTPVDLYTLTNSSGMVVKIMTYGGIMQEVLVPDQRHHMANVTLGFATLNDYVSTGNSPYFGALIGRYGNRIALGDRSRWTGSPTTCPSTTGRTRSTAASSASTSTSGT